MNASAASTNDCAIAIVCTIISSLRLSDRSATRPAHAPSSSTGANWHAVSRPTAKPLPVRLQDEQGLGDQRQPVADLRDQLTAEEQAEVADVQRLERLADAVEEPLPHDSSRSRAIVVSSSSTSSAAARRARSSGGRSWRRAASHSVRRLRFSASWLLPAAADLDPAHTAVGLVDPAVDETAGGELGDDVRRRGRRDLLAGRQLAQGQRAVTLDGRERSPERRREAALVLAAHQAGEAGDRHPQPARHLHGVGAGARHGDGRGGGRGGRRGARGGFP